MNPIRIGRFTSSEIVALTTNGRAKDTYGAAFKSYVKKKRQERKMGCYFSSPDSGKAAKWGSFCEWWIMRKRPDILGLNYTLSPNKTDSHPELGDFWAGSRDGFNNDTKAVIDLKCPWTRESFADFGDCTSIDEVRNLHKDGEKYYWQLVSNACIAGVDKAELIIFMPTEKQLAEIVHSAIHADHPFQNEVYFIGSAVEGDLPFIPAQSQYPNLLRFEFDVPQEDKDFLTNRVIEAAKLLQ